MNERLKTTYANFSIKTLLTFLTLQMGISVTELKAFEPNELRVNSNIFVASNLLQESSLGGKDSYESFILTVKFKGEWYSFGVKGNAKSITGVNVKVIEDKMLRMIPGLKFSEPEGFFMTHNHSAEVILGEFSHLKLDLKNVIDKNKLLAGPSNNLGDCPRPVPGLVSLVVEPGGRWLCKVADDGLNTISNGHNLESLRKDLILASQKYDGEELKKHIENYIRQVRLLNGLMMEFIPNDTNEKDFLEIVDNFSK